MSQNLPKRSLRDFLFYVILTVSYLRAQTIETSTLPNDSMRPLFKQIETFSGILTVYFNCKYYYNKSNQYALNHSKLKLCRDKEIHN